VMLNRLKVPDRPACKVDSGACGNAGAVATLVPCWFSSATAKLESA